VAGGHPHALDADSPQSATAHPDGRCGLRDYPRVDRLPKAGRGALQLHVQRAGGSEGTSNRGHPLRSIHQCAAGELAARISWLDRTAVSGPWGDRLRFHGRAVCPGAGRWPFRPGRLSWLLWRILRTAWGPTNEPRDAIRGAGPDTSPASWP
jgi:hypothetical protein